MPSIRCTRARIGGCHAAGPFHRSCAAVQRISHCRSAAGSFSQANCATAPVMASSPVSCAFASISDSTSRASKSRARSSIGRAPGVRSASSGKLASSHCAKAWIVSIRSPPPGQSSTLANSERARTCVSGPISAPSLPSSTPSSPASSRTQRASTALIRLAISAAPDLVNVRHRICDGSTPGVSSSRRTRADRTCVLPVPADADSQTLSAGSAAPSWFPASL